MDLIQILVLALVQGLTEFLPISSSAHLILVPRLVGWPDQGLAFDVAVHVGTLLAVLVYFRRELGRMTRDWLASVTTRRQTVDSRLAWGVLIGTLPVGLAGLAFADLVGTTLRSPLVIGAATIAFGLILWWADRRGRHRRDETELDLRGFLLIGLAQALALIPGTSRSGITMTAALFLGLTRPAAARVSFLLSIPVIVLAGGREAYELILLDDAVVWREVLIGAAVSALAAYLCIHFFIRFLDRIGMTPFVVYRLLLGGLIFALFW